MGSETSVQIDPVHPLSHIGARQRVSSAGQSGRALNAVGGNSLPRVSLNQAGFRYRNFCSKMILISGYKNSKLHCFSPGQSGKQAIIPRVKMRRSTNNDNRESVMKTRRRQVAWIPTWESSLSRNGLWIVVVDHEK